MGDELKRIAHMPKAFIERICWVFVDMYVDMYVASTVLVQSLPLHFSKREIVVTNKIQEHNQDIIKNNVHLRMS